ncbi:MAG: hypothetical protein V3W41_00020 [Planctomycetota bacterium]
MPANSTILTTLSCPDRLPLIVTRLELEVTYAAAGHRPSERAEELKDTFNSLAGLINAGFLGRSQGREGSTTITVSRLTADTTVIALESVGVHVNFLPAAIRVIYHLHQLPPNALEDLARTLGSEDEARAILNDLVYQRDICKLVVTAEGPNGVDLVDASPLEPIADGVPSLGHGSLMGLVEARSVCVSVLANNAELSEDLEDDWLSTAMVGAFVPLDTVIENEPGEEELDFRDGEFVIENISVEGPYLAELLFALASGQLDDVRVRITP